MFVSSVVRPLSLVVTAFGCRASVLGSVPGEVGFQLFVYVSCYQYVSLKVPRSLGSAGS